MMKKMRGSDSSSKFSLAYAEWELRYCTESSWKGKEYLYF
jgi:hypothetical protein